MLSLKMTFKLEAWVLEIYMQLFLEIRKEKFSLSQSVKERTQPAI